MTNKEWINRTLRMISDTATLLDNMGFTARAGCFFCYTLASGAQAYGRVPMQYHG